MSGLFTNSDPNEGKIGIGKVDQSMHDDIRALAQEYYDTIPDKQATTYHTWFTNMPPHIKERVSRLQNNPFMTKLCEGDSKCTFINMYEMDELYYSNPLNSKISNLYGAAGNFDVHRDSGYFTFNGVKMYRLLIGLTDNNNSITTHFTEFNKGIKINSKDYIIFDYDRTSHQVIKENNDRAPRILLKLHFIVCEEGCTHSQSYINFIKFSYIYYDYISRAIMDYGTDPSTFSEFFIGLACQYYLGIQTFFGETLGTSLLSLIIDLGLFILFMLGLMFGNAKLFKLKFKWANSTKLILYSLGELLVIYTAIVLFYWGRYKLTGYK